MKRQHTPVAHYCLIEYEGNEWFHVFDENTGQLVGKFQRRDQAEKFVRAVNSFEDILGELKIAHERDCVSRWICDETCGVREAIAQAEGKP